MKYALTTREVNIIYRALREYRHPAYEDYYKCELYNLIGKIEKFYTFIISEDEKEIYMIPKQKLILKARRIKNEN